MAVLLDKYVAGRRFHFIANLTKSWRLEFNGKCPLRFGRMFILRIGPLMLYGLYENLVAFVAAGGTPRTDEGKRAVGMVA